VDADDSTTPRAFIFLPLVFEEGIYPALLNLFEVVNHTHVVVLSIAFIYASQTIAGEIIAFKSKGNSVIGQLLAVAFKKGALFISRAASSTMNYFASLSRKIPGISEVSTADAAIHAAGSD
jgi:hypothetical protein